MVRNCVLPLAGRPSNVLWKWRHGGHTELGILAIALRVQVDIHDIERRVFITKDGLMGSKLNVNLLSLGNHIEVVFR